MILLVLLIKYRGLAMSKDRDVTVVEVKCPLCDHTEIVYIPKEDIPECPIHRVKMNIHEILEEGKSC
jgi:hypothetical protein